MRIFIFILLCFFFVACKNNNRTAEFKKTEIMNDTISGMVTLKNPSGQVKERGVLIHGRKNGIWKSYDETGSLSSVGYYYKDEKVSDIAKEDFVFSRVSCDNIDINLPSNWTIKKKYKQALILSVKPIFNDSIFAPTINILKVEIPSQVEFPQFIIANKKDLVNNYQEIKFKEEKELKISNNRAYEMLYFVKTNNRKLGVLSTYVLEGNFCYIITCIAEGKGEEFVKYNDLFKEISSSISFSTGV